jgi:hypothetical protein
MCDVPHSLLVLQHCSMSGCLAIVCVTAPCVLLTSGFAVVQKHHVRVISEHVLRIVSY